MSDSSVFGFFLMGAVYLAVPVIVYLWLRKYGSANVTDEVIYHTDDNI